MARARREIRVVEVERPDAVRGHGAEERRERLGLGIHALQQHRLAQQHEAGIGKAGDGGFGGGREFASVVRVDRDAHGPAGDGECADHLRGHPLRRHHRHAAMPAHELHMRNAREPLAHGTDAPGREHQRIAAGDNHLEDAGMRRDVIENHPEFGIIKRAVAVRTHHLAAEAEAAIDRAGMERLDQHAIRVAMHEALDGRM